ncbi:hypothetical protein [Falsiroseomonas selenitidurans]|uniref:Uncharacterized protein n=1 Tax=Falsiroseomonas selenitidurans TaxID=2716335 RepID=A0ABX1E8W0_9PROT|nr:hypothetical protein [Falsiroseomonas selenitidurans]NKC33476.1 hypothetical protein [Falsiroseomonas selenitidurans]
MQAPEPDAALREAARAMDAALSGLFRDGPQAAGSDTYLGGVDEAWRKLRAALAPAAPAP